ncbi:inovirus Gp2 family protein [Vibrio coralliilyticus]|uniref:inovirus Gp2 family protein n=1 Tax=Vibrio coralliilyticus TaxID=190893 RepID=UPI00148C40B7|nr:inovirus Gp2 family protein [Vibrio coralliilyticus]NOI20944.1 inovirus Gp2 family protein [Vibrio coralliilyticus]
MSKNLTITHEPTFNGNNIYIDKEGLVVEYLEGIESVLEKALEQYARLFVVRVDLNLPADFRGDDSAVMTRFFRSLKSQIAAYRRRSARLNGKPYRETTIRYVWAKECDTSTSSHYHVALIFDRNVFRSLGDFGEYQQSLANRIRNAWKRSVDAIYSGKEKPAIHFSKQGQYHLLRNSEEFEAVFQSVFYRLSYLAKRRTKHFGKRMNNFDHSRR